MTDSCVFCGYEGEDFIPEHWIPQWLSRELIPKYASGVRHNLPSGQSWEADAFEVTVDHVCHKCNNNWLSEIETKAKRYVLPLILGVADSETINPQGLRHVARWCYLKALSLELGRPGHHKPTHDASVYADLKQTKWPPANCSIALGIRDIDEPDPVFLWFTSHGLQFSGTAHGPNAPSGKTSMAGYETTLLIGHLVIDVIGVRLPVHLDMAHAEGFNVLWPLPLIGGVFTWAPDRRFLWRDDKLSLKDP